MKILVTGSRKWADRNRIEELIIETGATILVHGGAKGADSLAKQVALDLGLDEREYKAEWDKYGKGAGPWRNQQMLNIEHTTEEPIDLVLAFPLSDSIGTYDMMRRAEKAGIEVIVVE